MAENFLDKAKETAKTVSEKLKGSDNEKAQQASEQIDKFTGGSDDNKEEDNKDEK
ncbi:hypothetical protein [Staphylococcus equorum]|uniref:hypothetical protein n=1 Tax=Staphylococcus equorum TaxID=246432 RepID=UPI0016AC5CB3|nr:hypothetical protein [Staphylococcus equorum]MDK9856338.1 hypothetical protein [Staphylococcus equorum]MDK9873750.1 hypothetical protein [Staphylococcus equorum]NLK10553.1 hypothetical protein [Staphylococcus equorum]